MTEEQWRTLIMIAVTALAVIFLLLLMTISPADAQGYTYAEMPQIPFAVTIF